MGQDSNELRNSFPWMLYLIVSLIREFFTIFSINLGQGVEETYEIGQMMPDKKFENSMEIFTFLPDVKFNAEHKKVHVTLALEALSGHLNFKIR